KLLKGSGVKKDMEGNDVHWQMLSYQFKPAMDAPQAFSFTSFDTDAETKYGLVVGEKYIIDYVTKPNKSFPESPHKNLISVRKGELPSNIPVPSTLETTATETATNPPPQLFEEFAAIYLKQIEGNPNKSSAHMMATFLVSYHMKEYRDLFAKCCAKLGVELPE
ncbi:unnamed protein product, partial [marine sediment metagenome]